MVAILLVAITIIMTEDFLQEAHPPLGWLGPSKVPNFLLSQHFLWSHFKRFLFLDLLLILLAGLDHMECDCFLACFTHGQRLSLVPSRCSINIHLFSFPSCLRAAGKSGTLSLASPALWICCSKHDVCIVKSEMHPQGGSFLKRLFPPQAK